MDILENSTRDVRVWCHVKVKEHVKVSCSRYFLVLACSKTDSFAWLNPKEIFTMFYTVGQL